MPKKHQPNYTKQNYTHPSPASQTAASSNSSYSPKTSTVNEILTQLRREQNQKITADRRDEAELVASHKTVPPTLRSILSIPETAPIIPKHGLRQRAVRGRQVPGPAPPASWLQRSRHAPPAVTRRKDGSSDETNIQAGFRDLLTLPAHNSLVYFTLKQMARDWEWTSAFEHNNLCTLPAPYKAWLLSFLALYGPEEGITIQGLKTIFYSEAEVEGGSGGFEVNTLDLSGQIGNLTVLELSKYIAEPMPSPTESIEESWDEVEESKLEIPPMLSRFPHLTRLSLARPTTNTASWSQLLTLSKQLHTLTHLSLAFWPMPTMTPNSKTARMQSRFSRPVQYSGTHLYAQIDDDYYEPANILRRLSVNTYSLKWLDLEGCSWVKALVWEPTLSDVGPRWRDNRLAFDERLEGLSLEEEAMSGEPRSIGPDWNGAWSQIEYLRLVQGTGGNRLSLDLEKDVNWVAAELRALRLERRGKYCHIDRGNT